MFMPICHADYCDIVLPTHFPILTINVYAGI